VDLDRRDGDAAARTGPPPEAPAPDPLSALWRGARIRVGRMEAVTGAARGPLELATAGPSLYLVERGPCRLQVDDSHDEWIEAAEHDLVLATRGARLQVTCDRGDGRPTLTVVAWTIEGDSGLLAPLPTLLRLAAGPRAKPWQRHVAVVLASELHGGGPGSPALLEHLLQAALIAAARDHLHGDAPWLGAVLDPRIGPVLALLHDHPEEPWSLASLAREACMSRSTFVARFTERLGVPPARYLAECRMRRARVLLRETRAGLKEVASRTGFATESAFCHAFRRWHGESPTSFRTSGSPPHGR